MALSQNRSLNSLALGETAIVTTIDGDRAWQRRLAALGIVTGQKIKLTGRASLGQTLALRVGRVTDVALRPQDAAHILVNPITPLGIEERVET
ncbi:ferrous iron transport protein A [Candidatus Synechococcus calcipolaris G9]|uniref:Ferrous iron transport protein A n=1 Tax=Candidatus Synechococcus calcipolaris G9 TaxID=1497997 RepID=A0ABT6F0H9_9SYNE|nr:FeoA family protein [Candidatus Synechococcus calcipolaris]MDG2991288.1 ferrous iron transport protein A [Candidatus Synechococcus calcipolaris G9]